MLGPQLQYQSLKTVLLHTDANTRFRISVHMPSIRSVEKMIPLKIKFFMFNDHSTSINDTSYQLGIFRYYPDGSVPRKTKKENVSGGVPQDIDEFGFQRLSNNVSLPGDISFRQENWIERRNDTEAEERRHRSNLRDHEAALEKLNELKSKGITVNDYLQTPVCPGEEEMIRTLLQRFSDDLPSQTEDCKLELLPFDCRRDNTKPPFTCYIQLTIMNGENKQIHQFEYNKKLFEAVKHLNEVIFGSRTTPIQVQQLLSDSFSYSDGICRLPVGFRLQVEQVHVMGDTAAHKSFPLLVENSDSLGSVWMHYFSDPRQFQNQVVRNARRVDITYSPEYGLESVTQVIRTLPNLKISIWPTKLLSPEDSFSMIQAWLSRDRPVGASFRMLVSDEETARDVPKLVSTRLERTETTERCVTIWRSNATKVEVSYVRWFMEAQIVNV